MSIETGRYIIDPKDKKLGWVGRHFIEDRSLLPKKILTLPEGVQPPQWILEKLPSGNYIFRANDATTGVKDGLLWALLIDMFPAEEWFLNKQDGNIMYTWACIFSHAGAGYPKVLSVL
ncbi:hypothetical protein ABW20_dc0107213 [Dactylellina cionopaga]|nr:hypothetical protein ABW20_dc0107213 [Dactylellina cionopaga]